jgi:peptide subunit release factor 1 (eRF1)
VGAARMLAEAGGQCESRITMTSRWKVHHFVRRIEPLVPSFLVQNVGQIV